MSTATKPVPVSDLSGPALDWVVAGLEGTPREIVPTAEHPRKFFTFAAGYSSNWSLAGPIIEREEIELKVIPAARIPELWPTCAPHDTWCANIAPPDVDFNEAGGPTPLTAALRCYVASRLGDTVQIPGELL